jgi:hypothetical protein
MEAHPLVAELGQLKFERPGDPISLLEVGNRVAAAVPVETIDSEPDLITQSFAPDVLRALVGMRVAAIDAGDSEWAKHIKWALLGALRDCATVKVGWPYQRPGQPRIPRMPDPRVAFKRRISWMVEDLITDTCKHDATVMAGDARQSKPWSALLSGRLAAGVITSPPYLNNFDYADATRLELYFWGLATSWLEMTQAVRGDMLVATTQQARVAYAKASGELLAAAAPQSWQHIRDLLARLKAARALRPRGKEYDLLVCSYFADMAQVLLQIARHVAPKGPILFVLGDSAPYGVHIDTPAVVASIAQELGFDAEDTLTIRQRGHRWHTNGTRHAMALKESLVLLRSPGTC